MIEKILLLLICLTIYFFPDEDLDPPFIILFTFTLILLIKKIFTEKLELSLKFDFLSLSLLSLPFSMFISTIFSSYKYPSLLKLGEVVLLYLSYFVFVNLNEKEKKFALDIILILSVAHSIFSICKYCLIHQMRASGNFLNPNHSAFALLVGASLILSRSFAEKRRIYLFAIFPIFASIILSRSRSTIIAFLIFLPIFFLGKIKNKKFYYIVFLIVLTSIFLFLFPHPLSKFLMRTYDPFSFRRIQIWGVGVRMFIDNWLVGVGPSNFYYRVEPYRFPEKERIARYAITLGDAHNDYIQLLSEIGVFSLAFILGIFSLSIELLKKSMKSDDWREKGSSIALLTIFFNSFFTNSIFHLPISFLIILLLAQLLSQMSNEKNGFIKFKIEKKSGIILIFAFFFLLIADGLVPMISNKLLRDGAKVARTESIEKGLKLISLADRLTPLNSHVKKESGIVNKIIYLRTNEPFYLWRAVSALKESLRLNPFDHDSHKELAEIFTILLRRNGLKESFEMAESHWKKAISLAPFNPFHYYNLSNLYILIYNYKEAEKVLKKCIEIEPNFIMAHYYLYKIYEERKEDEKKEKKKEEVVRLIKMFANKNYPSLYFNILFSVPNKVVEEMIGR